MKADAAAKGIALLIPNDLPLASRLSGGASADVVRSTHKPSNKKASAFQPKCDQLRCTKQPKITPGSPLQVRGTMPRWRAAPGPSAAKPPMANAGPKSINN
mmetsp:Transcript_14362/g.24636  ORF Transcript_14362/g.24636 Transcript_14362/m.24636 type:complete len:101 (+) Transcript_14362:657-959(+)